MSSCCNGGHVTAATRKMEVFHILILVVLFRQHNPDFDLVKVAKAFEKRQRRRIVLTGVNLVPVAISTFVCSRSKTVRLRIHVHVRKSKLAQVPDITFGNTVGSSARNDFSQTLFKCIWILRCRGAYFTIIQRIQHSGSWSRTILAGLVHFKVERRS